MMRGKPHTIIFDVEGTLIDCVPQTIESWMQTLAAHGFIFSTEELHRYSGMDAKLMLQRLLPGRDQSLIKQLLDEQGERYRKHFLPTAKAFPHARELFSTLAGAGHRLGLATTCQPDELRSYLRLLNITDFVHAYVCGNEVEHEKPAPDLLQLAAERLMAADSAGVWTVGDTPYDAKAALAAGYQPIGTRGGGFSVDELKQAGCVEVAADLKELLACLCRHLADETGRR